MEEEAARVAEGQVTEVDPIVLTKKDALPRSINSIFTPPDHLNAVGHETAPNDVCANNHVTEEEADKNPPEPQQPLPDYDSDEGVLGDISHVKGAADVDGCAAEAETDFAHVKSDLVQPTDEEVDAALAELDSIPDMGVDGAQVDNEDDEGEEEEDEEEWAYYKMEPQNPAEVAAAEDVLVAEEVRNPSETIRTDDDKVQSLKVASPVSSPSDSPRGPSPREPSPRGLSPVNEDRHIPSPLLVGELPASPGSPHGPGSPRTVEGFVTSIELNAPEESFNTNVAINQSTGYFAAGRVEQSSGPFSVYVSNSPEPASMDDPPIDALSPADALPPADAIPPIDLLPSAPVEAEVAAVEIVHAQSTVEVGADLISAVDPEEPPSATPPAPSPLMPDVMTQSFTGDALPSVPLQEETMPEPQKHTPEVEVVEEDLLGGSPGPEAPVAPSPPPREMAAVEEVEVNMEAARPPPPFDPMTCSYHGGLDEPLSALAPPPTDAPEEEAVAKEEFEALEEAVAAMHVSEVPASHSTVPAKQEKPSAPKPSPRTLPVKPKETKSPKAAHAPVPSAASKARPAATSAKAPPATKAAPRPRAPPSSSPSSRLTAARATASAVRPTAARPSTAPSGVTKPRPTASRTVGPPKTLAAAKASATPAPATKPALAAAPRRLSAGPAKPLTQTTKTTVSPKMPNGEAPRPSSAKTATSATKTATSATKTATSATRTAISATRTATSATRTVTSATRTTTTSTRPATTSTARTSSATARKTTLTTTAKPKTLSTAATTTTATTTTTTTAAAAAEPTKPKRAPLANSAPTKDNKNTTNRLLSSRAAPLKTTQAATKMTMTNKPRPTPTRLSKTPDTKAKRSPTKEAKASPVSNGENKIVAEETAIESEEKLRQEKIILTQEALQDDVTSDDVATPAKGSVLINGDH